MGFVLEIPPFFPPVGPWFCYYAIWRIRKKSKIAAAVIPAFIWNPVFFCGHLESRSGRAWRKSDFLRFHQIYPSRLRAILTMISAIVQIRALKTIFYTSSNLLRMALYRRRFALSVFYIFQIEPSAACHSGERSIKYKSMEVRLSRWRDSD